MSNNFPLKLRLMPPITTTDLAALNPNSHCNSSETNQEPNWVAEKASHLITPKNTEEPKPILRNQSVTLKAQHRGKHLIERFAELYTELDSADVSIVCGRSHEILKAPRFVLSVGSEYFQDALKVAPCKHPIVVLKEVPGDVMSRVLEYIYLGQVLLESESELKKFLKSASNLQVFGIREEHFSVED